MAKERGFSVSLVVPARNEAGKILRTLEAYYSHFSRNFRDFEIIVVCNNCSDNTFDVAEKFAKSRKRVIVLDFPEKIGKGGAVIEGFKKASKGLVGFTDADLSYSPLEFSKLVEELRSGNSDAAVASRAAKDSVLPKSQPFLRVFLGSSFRLFVGLLFGLGVNDTQAGAKLFRRKALLKVLPSLSVKGWEFDVDLLWKLKRAGFRISEVGVRVTERKESGLNPVSDSLKMFFGLLKLRLSG